MITKMKNKKILGLIMLIIMISFATNSLATEIKIPNPLDYETFTQLLEAVLTFLQYVGAVIAVFALIASAFKFMSAGGDPEKVKEGYQMIFWTIIGLFVIISARAFIEFLRAHLQVRQSQ